MAKTIVGLFDTFAATQKVVTDLQDVGFRHEDISLVASDARGEYQRAFGGERENLDRGDLDTQHSGTDAGKGASVGAVLGGFAGLLVGLGMLAVPGVGPVLAAGPILTALAGAGVGAAAGGLIGALTGVGVPEDEARQYAEGVRRGGTLVTVTADDGMAQQAVDVMNRYQPVDIHERSAQWQGASQDVTQASTRGASYPRRPDSNTDVSAQRSQDLSIDAGMPRGTDADRTADRMLDRENESWRNDPNMSRNAGGSQGNDNAASPSESVGGGVPDRAREMESYNGTLAASNPSGLEALGGLADFTRNEDHFREHYQARFASSDYEYEQFRPAYQYGYGLALNDQYRGRNWDEIEANVRRDWERDHPDSAWDTFHDAVYEGWNYQSYTSRGSERGADRNERW